MLVVIGGESITNTSAARNHGNKLVAHACTTFTTRLHGDEDDDIKTI